ILLDEPNVLILDEPTNDLDTDMLAAIEDLLDTWPGTLVVVSHDRYLIERVTDQQFAVLSGHLRHLPGGVEEYLALQARLRDAPGATGTASSPTTDNKNAVHSTPKLAGADLRNAEKERGSTERKLEKLGAEIAS